MRGLKSDMADALKDAGDILDKANVPHKTDDIVRLACATLIVEALRDMRSTLAEAIKEGTMDIATAIAERPS